MKTSLYAFLLIGFLLGCSGADTEPAPGLTKEDVEFGANTPIIDDIQYTMTNNGVAPTTVTLTGKSRYATVHEWSSGQFGPQVKSNTESVSFNLTSYGRYAFSLSAFRSLQARSNYLTNRNQPADAKSIYIQVKPAKITLTNKTAFSSSTVQFGGRPYCTYSGRFTEGSLTYTKLEDNTFIAASLTARYTESIVGTCGSSPAASNVQVFELTAPPFVSGSSWLCVFETKAGGYPKYRATYYTSDRGDAGTIYFERIDALAQATSLFKAPMNVSYFRLE